MEKISQEKLAEFNEKLIALLNEYQIELIAQIGVVPMQPLPMNESNEIVDVEVEGEEGEVNTDSE